MLSSESFDDIYNRGIFFIKYIFKISLVLYIIFKNSIDIILNPKEIIEIDNELRLNLYENDISFNEYKTQITPLAFYYPEYNNISYSKFFNTNKQLDQIYFDELKQLIEKQIILAKNHGIYGFAIYFDLFDINYFHEVLNNFISNKYNFPYFLIWKNDKLKNINNKTLENLINNIQQYLISDNYIKIMEKPVLSISEPNLFFNIKDIISNIQKKAKKNKIGELFLLYPFAGNFTDNIFLTEFDATYDFSQIDLFDHFTTNPNILYYSGIIYKNLILNQLNFNFSFYRSCYLNYKIFDDYRPEKFFIANNLIFQWENTYFNKNKGILFVDSWNNYKNGKYLELDPNYGYASINSFSKSLFHLPYKQNNYNVFNSNITIAIQVHVYYEDLLEKIIDKLNLIPFQYDLFFSTISQEKKKFIEKSLFNSNANYQEIQIFENKGRDILPFLEQMKTKYKNYKYICHIHTKKSNHQSLLGTNWRNYIYSNLFGSKNIISEIIFDFENNKKLGFIFPEIYYVLKKDVFEFNQVNFFLNQPNKKYMNLILGRIFGNYEVGKKLAFPAGNMFWAKTKAIYQIFNVRLRYPKELNQTNETIMHGIERIWLYLVKLNGYYYKTIFKHY